ncbi:putative DNA protecting protein DprA [Selenomonas ruminantium subsp. lactilytica TAM6421]|uniref:Putative DNA protecting protein DprA n=1 Tax=Selenomonas ruminantium subsp. lactilytica (strain NBRC 103574 / TAM6421) TaxID=927704 RepID=I0GN99_SELRL|nr:putative DNA protecting protein DprA [Selenomonas ruminantium subsp. lactilytica TAM6421]
MMKLNEANFYLAAMLRCPGIGCRYMQRLLAVMKEPGTIWQTDARTLSDTKVLPPQLAKRLADFCRQNESAPEEIQKVCEQKQIQTVSILEENYPEVLREIYAPPVILYYNGILESDARRVAMVGSRRYSGYGQAIALEFGEKLAAAGLTVVSGAARGIDSFSHLGALKGGRTVAVLGCGVDIAYPSENRKLLYDIADSGGAVISEYEPGTRPLPAYFPARNRIISGLAEGTLVVEAAERSGSLITAEMALAAGRDVYAIPGSIYAPGCAGCNNLIRQGAKLVAEPADVLEEFGLAVKQPVKKAGLKLTAEEAAIYQVLSFEHPLSMDEIMLSLPDGEIANLSYQLLQMEMKGIVIENELHCFRRAERE